MIAVWRQRKSSIKKGEKNMKNNRVFWSSLTVLFLLLLLAPAAAVSAIGKPIHTQAPFVAFTVTDACEFDVYWEPLADNGHFTIITARDATRYILTGTLKSRLTNVETGKFVERNTSAQFTQTFFNDGSYQAVSHGPFIGWFGFPGNPPLTYNKGRQLVKYDAEGNLIEAVQSGKVEDLCLTLSD
jgi:hypothetical protein